MRGRKWWLCRPDREHTETRTPSIGAASGGGPRGRAWPFPWQASGGSSEGAPGADGALATYRQAGSPSEIPPMACNPASAAFRLARTAPGSLLRLLPTGTPPRRWRRVRPADPRTLRAQLTAPEAFYAQGLLGTIAAIENCPPNSIARVPICPNSQAAAGVSADTTCTADTTRTTNTTGTSVTVCISASLIAHSGLRAGTSVTTGGGASAGATDGLVTTARTVAAGSAVDTDTTDTPDAASSPVTTAETATTCTAAATVATDTSVTVGNLSRWAPCPNGQSVRIDNLSL